LDTLLSWLPDASNFWVQIGLAGAWLVLVGLVAEACYRFTNVGSEVVRKIVHIGAGNVIVLAWWLRIPGWVGIAASVLFSGITLLSYYVPILPGINGIGRKSLGTFFYAVSIGLLVSYFWPMGKPYYAVIGILIMTWGDGLAALIGQRFGKHRYVLWGMEKSWEGSLTMALVSLIVTSLVLLVVQGPVWQTWVTALVVAIAATILEAFSQFGIDNLTVPLGSALVSLGLGYLLPLG
jgi:phytol kinase